ncbi:hypothetical protein GCM10011386_33440 [Parapedobacter defluvii]|uniref:Transposase/invertase (TIGR01784 family) n=2 Tax=Parapedobacter defluvii TaxID=2045106 RepID=A0ABQ1MCX8_9SPHI|nr:hypothetical protein GCM10011386_33440 [Parapedobacter defluvii]
MYDTNLKRKWDMAGVLEYARREGEEKGIEKGIEKGKAAVVANLLATGKFTVSEIAELATVPEDLVKKVRDDLDKKKK